MATPYPSVPIRLSCPWDSMIRICCRPWSFPSDNGIPSCSDCFFGVPKAFPEWNLRLNSDCSRINEQCGKIACCDRTENPLTTAARFGRMLFAHSTPPPARKPVFREDGKSLNAVDRWSGRRKTARQHRHRAVRHSDFATFRFLPSFRSTEILKPRSPALPLTPTCQRRRFRWCRGQ
jgi:hypothetical protein